MTRNEPPQKLSSPNSAAEWFWPLITFMGVESATTISEAGLLSSCCACAQCFSVFSTTTDPFRVPFRFSGPTRPPISLCKGQKHLAPQIGDGRSPLLMRCTSIVILSFLDNNRPLSSPVSNSRTDSTPLNLCKGRKHSAARIGYCNFYGRSPFLVLCMSMMIFIYLDNRIFFVRLVL
jgi:hypothetical protein